MSPLPGTALLLTAFLLASSAAPASAQTRLYILIAGDSLSTCSAGCEPSRLLEIDVDGRQFVAATPVLHARELVTGPQATPDGYLVWRGGERRIGTQVSDDAVSVFAPSTRQQAVVASMPLGTGGAVFTHPSAVRAFTQGSPGARVTIMEPDGLRALPESMCAGGRLVAMSSDGSRLLAECAADGRVDVIDSATGIAATIFHTASNDAYAANTDGSELYTGNQWSTAGPIVVRRLVGLGYIEAESVGELPGIEIALDYDLRSHRVFARTSDVVGVLDDQTLEYLDSLPAPAGFFPAHLALDPDRAEAYVVWQGTIATGGIHNRLALIETDTLTVVAEADLPGDTRVAGMVLGPRPPRVANLSSAVNGDVVTLEWTLEPSRSLATGLVIEAGSAPGLADLARLQVPARETTTMVPNVPPGTYSVRVRAVNATGPGEPSNAITIVVP
ncbi:MAG: hypothetical protein IT179_06820 [Acidobacteria bacterium]|nr:hypothetical protein [Acidobacteriota bacterium]